MSGDKYDTKDENNTTEKQNSSPDNMKTEETDINNNQTEEIFQERSVVEKIGSTSDIFLGEQFHDEEANLRNGNRSLWFIIIILVFLYLVLIMGYNSLADKIKVQITIPPQNYDLNGTTDVKKNDADDFYYKVMGQYILEPTLEFTPENFSEVNISPSKFMTKRRYAFKQIDFEKESAFVENNTISQRLISFSVDKEVKRTHGVAIVTLNVAVQQKIGELEDPIKNCKYKIALFRQDWKLYVFDYGQTCFDDFKKELERK